MKDFDSLKQKWQDEKITAPAAGKLSKGSADSKNRLMSEQLTGAVCLIVTGVLLIIMAVFGNFNFTRWYTYAAMGMIALICFLQAALLYYTYRIIKRINETASPSIHLKQWEDYYEFRRNIMKWNGRVYFILLNAAMGLYFLEVLSGRPFLNVAILLAAFIGWMLFAYFYLGKKAVRKQENHLQAILTELRSVAKQLENDVVADTPV